MLLSLRKIKSFLFKANPIDSANQTIKLIGWNIIEETQSNYKIKKEDRLLTIRKYPSSDLAVFKQVLIQKEYDAVLNYFIDNQIDCKYIIDAGSNAGYTLFLFKSFLPTATIIAVEADEANYKTLVQNIEQNGFTGVIPMNYAIHNKDNTSMVISDDFRGGGDWAKKTNETNINTELKSITIDKILALYPTDIIDILKIDIEGAEQFLFQDIDTAAFLKKTKVLALEIHDELQIREKIYTILKHYSFLIFNFGETTVAINRNYL